MSLQTLKDQKGFTIVELLIVIVVIGILAAITIVAFNGVQNQAKTTKSQAVASDVQKKAEAYNATNSRYPVLSTEFAGIAALSAGNSVAIATTATVTAPAAADRESQVVYQPCPVGASAATITGARIHYYDFTAGSGGAMTTPTATGKKSITVGTCA